jgi:hypothetical protein
LSTIRSILKDPGYYRKLVIGEIRPKIEEAMTPEKWAAHFFEATGL